MGSVLCAKDYKNTYEIRDFNSLIDNINNSSGNTELKIKNEISVTETIIIPKGKNITLSGDGILIRDKGFVSQNSTLISIKEGGNLTIDGVTINGNNTPVYISNNNGSIIDCEGVFTLKSGRIHNDSHYGFNSSTINVGGSSEKGGSKAKFIMSGGVINDNTVANTESSGNRTQSCGVIGVYNGGSFELKDGSIKNNILDINNTINTAAIFVTPDFNYFDSADSYFKMSGGEISNNKANYGGVLIGTDYQTDYTNEAHFVMDGGIISNNKATRFASSGGYGGGVMVNLNGNFTLNKGIIKGNKAIMGGGVCVNDGYVSNGAEAAGFEHNDWINKYHCPGSFIMNGGTIEDNVAENFIAGDEGCGGGIYVASNKVVLNGGMIQNNKAERQGGGVYVGSTPYILQMNEVVITENNATLGGGLWFCPTGTVEISVKNGGAVFDNSAKNAGDDFMAENKNEEEQKKYYAYLSSRMLGGGKTIWYEDKENVRFKDTKNPIEMSETNKNIPVKDNIYLHCKASQGSKNIANKEKKLLIRNNEAVKGGGVGSNGAIKIGQRDNDELSLKVEKSFANNYPDNLKPDSIKIYLTIDGIKTDYIELTKESGYKGSFTHLPNVGNVLKKYNIVEEDLNLSIPVYGDAVLNGKTITIKLINRLNNERDKGDLSVSKTVIGKDIDTSKSFKFIVTLNDKSINGNYGDIEFKNGVSSFELKHGQSKIAKGLPFNVKYSVKEINYKGYKVKSINSTGEINNKISNVKFENHKISEGLSVKNSPETGDDNNLYMYIILLAASVVMLTIVAFTINKKNTK